MEKGCSWRSNEDFSPSALLMFSRPTILQGRHRRGGKIETFLLLHSLNFHSAPGQTWWTQNISQQNRNIYQNSIYLVERPFHREKNYLSFIWSYFLIKKISQCTMCRSPLQSVNRTIYQNVYLAPHFFPAPLFQMTNIWRKYLITFTFIVCLATWVMNNHSHNKIQ